MNTLFKIALLFSIALVAACKSDFYIDTYASDLFLDTNLDTPAKMMVEIPSCASVADYETKVLALFDTASNAKTIGCEEQGMNSMLVVSLTAEVASENSARDIILFRDIVEDVTHDGSIYEVRGLKPVISPNFFTRVNSLLQENLQTLSYENITIRFVLNNDEKSEILVTARNLWVNGEAREAFHRQPLGRRGKLELLMSNLISDLVIQGKQPLTFYVYRPK